MNDTSHPETGILAWKARIVPVLGYGIALMLLAGAPAIVLASLVLAVLANDAGIVGPGLLGGAVLGAAGGLSLLGCLGRTGKR